MSTKKLIAVGQAYTYTEDGTEHDAFVYLDPEGLEIFVIEGAEPARGGRTESDLIPVADWLRDRPEWADDVRRTVLRRLDPG